MIDYEELLNEYNNTIPENKRLTLHSVDTGLNMMFIESTSNGTDEYTKNFTKFMEKKNSKIVVSVIYQKEPEKIKLKNKNNFSTPAISQRI